MQQQVSSYLLQGFICQKDPPSVRVWQDAPGNSAPKRGTQLGGRLLCPCHFSLNCRTAPKHTPSAHARRSGPSVACKGTVHLSGFGVTPDVCDTRLGNKPIQSLLLHFPRKHFQENIQVVYVPEPHFQRKR